MKLNEMITVTQQQRARKIANDPKFCGYHESSFETKHGTINLFLCPASNGVFRGDVVRKNWSLNGKRISAKKLAAIVGC